MRVKDCPDLTKLTPEEREDFWKTHDPRKLKNLGDRLLAESLPHVESTRPREEVCDDIVERINGLNSSLEQVAEWLGVTPDILEAWANDQVKPPDCLPRVLDRIKELVTARSD